MSMYRARPMTPPEMRQLYAENPAIRGVVQRTLRALHRSTDKTEAETLIDQLVAASVKIGAARGLLGERAPYPHPTLVAQWVEALSTREGLPSVAPSEETAADVLGPLAATFRFPTREVDEWARTFARLGVGNVGTTSRSTLDTRLPHWFRTRIHPLKIDAPSGSNLRGFRLRRIKLRVPLGTQYVRLARSGRYVSVPTGYRTLVLSCEPGSHLHHMCGEIWFAVGRDGKAIQLAAQRTSRVTEEDLLRALAVEGVTGEANALPADAPSLDAIAGEASAKSLERLQAAIAKLRQQAGETTRGAQLLASKR